MRFFVFTLFTFLSLITFAGEKLEKGQSQLVCNQNYERLNYIISQDSITAMQYSYGGRVSSVSIEKPYNVISITTASKLDAFDNQELSYCALVQKL